MKWLLAWRQRLGLTQVQLGNKSGIDSNMISRYERNTATPSLDNVERLALGLGITVDELLNGPQSEEWELKIKLSKEGVIDVSGLRPSAEINVGDKGIAVTLSGSYELWADDAKFENFVEQLRNKRQAALKFYQEAF